MHSLKVGADGDLTVSGGRVQSVTGREKLLQDMRLYLSEAYGVDRFHPAYGSLLQGMVGSFVSADLALRVEVEAARVLSNLQTYQRSLFEKSPASYDRAELLNAVDDIQASWSGDRLFLDITFRDGYGESGTLSQEWGL